MEVGELRILADPLTQLGYGTLVLTTDIDLSLLARRTVAGGGHADLAVTDAYASGVLLGSGGGLAIASSSHAVFGFAKADRGSVRTLTSLGRCSSAADLISPNLGFRAVALSAESSVLIVADTLGARGALRPASPFPTRGLLRRGSGARGSASINSGLSPSVLGGHSTASGLASGGSLALGSDASLLLLSGAVRASLAMLRIPLAGLEGAKLRIVALLETIGRMGLSADGALGSIGLALLHLLLLALIALGSPARAVLGLAVTLELGELQIVDGAKALAVLAKHVLADDFVSGHRLIKLLALNALHSDLAHLSAPLLLLAHLLAGLLLGGSLLSSGRFTLLLKRSGLGGYEGCSPDRTRKEQGRNRFVDVHALSLVDG
jgi:hypothetical protein